MKNKYSSSSSILDVFWVLDFLSEEYPNMNRSHIILLMEDILHQLIGRVSHYLQHQVLYIPGGAGFLPSTVSCPLHLPPMESEILVENSQT